MTFVTVADKSAGDAFSEAMWDTYIKDNLNKGVNRPIQDVILGGSAASFDFTSIDQNFAHLKLVLYTRGDTAALTQTVTVRFNNDSGASYDFEDATFAAAGIAAAESLLATSGRVGLMPAATSPANWFAGTTIDIPYYAGSANNKIAICQSFTPNNTTAANHVIELAGTQWLSNAAITRITLLPGANNFVAGSRATLYGLAAS